MRIVAGEFKGRVIDSPSEKTTRPTTDRVRESMFSSILSRTDDLSIEGFNVLDAFGGSGALGFEALSRGAARCSFWEQDADARCVLEANAASLGLDRHRWSCKSGDVLASSAKPLSFGVPFDLVTLDPPYALDPSEVAAFVARLVEHDDVRTGSIIVYEHVAANMDAALATFEGLSCASVTAHKKYGKVAVLYLEVL